MKFDKKTWSGHMFKESAIFRQVKLYIQLLRVQVCKHVN